MSNFFKESKNQIIIIAAIVIVGGGIYLWNAQLNTQLQTSTTTNTTTTQEISTSLQIDKGDGSAVRVYTVTLASGTSALYQLLEAAQTQNFTVATKDSSLGAYVNGIDGVEGSANSFWLFSVNGTPSEVGAGAYELKEGDVVEWKFSST